jgi:RNA recognition motif-containing protein
MSSRLFIGNLSYTATERDLRDAFVGLGYTPRTVTIVTDRETGQPRGFGFIELESPEKAKEAIAVADGTLISGRPIRVNEAHERERPAGGRGQRNDGHRDDDRRDRRRQRDTGRW